MGVTVDASAGWLIMKRPSRETTSSCLLVPAPGASLTGNSATGCSSRKGHVRGDGCRHEFPIRCDEVEFLALDRKSTRLNSSHSRASRMPSSA